MTDKIRHSKKGRQGQTGMLWLAFLGGFLLYYLLLVGHQYAHPIHWVYSGLGAIIGAVAYKLWYSRPFRSAEGGTLPVGFGRGLAVVLVVVAAIVFMAIAYS